MSAEFIANIAYQPLFIQKRKNHVRRMRPEGGDFERMDVIL